MGVLVLRPFFGVLLTTFVMSFIAQSFISNALKFLRAHKITKSIGNLSSTRSALVLVFYISIISIVSMLLVGTVPRLIADSQYLLRISESDDPYVFIANAVRNVLGDDSTARIENFLLWRDQGVTASAPRVSGVWGDARSSRFVKLLSSQLKTPVQSYLFSVVALTKRIAASATSALMQGVVSLLFSFLIMWDLPSLSRGVKSLANSKRKWVSELYTDVAPRVAVFASIMGRSFEAQALIALVNTVLTTAGMVFLGLPGVVFLALFVLLCSFIPVAGFILSTIPMLIVALTEYGVGKMLLVLLMVAVVHLVEAYVANPQIYSSLLELHPTLVLSALYMAEHFYGPKGMILAVPFAEYLVEEVIMGRAADVMPEADAEEEMEEAAFS